ncbi:TonB-dependent receptor [Candidatus Nitronereus thalassa]|uniref:TonB-dependent receptor n=1 Tax=Candidatus Nitronereus thalassa TaxID=3020898 RepID=A0ABU3K9L2_9BACT|nr:TonB-dependent receptor [Candidatus Nitronereus thalassa]MDT7043052.1 TonB-dependent receptor [Candidatus Nitronereus thalassa]
MINQVKKAYRAFSFLRICQKPGVVCRLLIPLWVLLLIHGLSLQIIEANPGITDDLLESSSDQVMDDLRFLQEETVSIAVLHEQPISEAPSNVYVITDDDIRLSGATDLPTVLRRVPGLEVIQMTAADFNVSVRGDNQLRANKLLVLIDGRSIYEDIQGEVFWKMIPVTLPEIKKIEVLKGPASAVYGFNAFDGVINIITKSPEEMKGMHVQVGAGELGSVTSSAVYGGKYDKLGYRLSLGRDQTNQWDSRSSLGFRVHKFNVQTEYELSSLATVSVSGGLADANRYDGPVTNLVISQGEPSQAYTKFEYKRPNLFLRAYWNRSSVPNLLQTNPLLPGPFAITDPNLSSNQTRKWNSYNFSGQHALEFGSTNRLSYGMDYRHNTVSSNFLDEFSREDRFGAYIQDEWQATSKLTATGGIRVDLHTEINPTYSPRVALIYRFLPNHTVRGTIAVAFRPPTIFETNTDSRSAFGSFVTGSLNGSSNLKPEEITSYEISYQGWFFKHRVRARADLFYNQVSDLINSVLLPPGGTALVFANGGEADIYGGEAGIEFWPLPWLSGFANYSYQNSDQTFAGTSQRGGPIFKVNTGFRGDWENGFTAEVILHHVEGATYPISSTFNSFVAQGRIPASNVPNPQVDSYTLLNLRGGYQFWNDQLELALSVFNALNDKHKEHPLGEIIGSRVMGWITFRY